MSDWSVKAMKSKNELNREYAIELSKLILDNPKMRVVVWINSEDISDDYGSWAGNFYSKPYIETIAYSEAREIWVSKENDNFEDCYNYYGWDAENWSDEGLEEKAKQIPWEDVIAVSVGVA